MANDLSHMPEPHEAEARKPRPSSGAAPFSERELFFSRTDRRGVILSGNAVFQRVADFAWPDMLNAPHKIIRHPDMPRAVFWLLWQTIETGAPVGAFVKNKARDGLHYWVFALISPLTDGYLSVRLKPTSALLPVIEAEYAALRAREREEDLTPEDSAGLLLARLAELGFENYAQFQAKAVLMELACKNNMDWRRQRPAVLGPLLEALEHLATLKGETQMLERRLSDLTCTLVNMRLIASRIEGANGPISLMAQNYGTVLQEARTWLREFALDEAGDLSRIGTAVESGGFKYGLSVVQQQAVKQFGREELPPEAGDRVREMALLQTEADHHRDLATDSLASILSCAHTLERAIREVRRSVAGLNSTRLMCRAEAARLGNTSSFAAIIDTLDVSQAKIEESAEKVLDNCQDLLSRISRIGDTLP